MVKKTKIEKQVKKSQKSLKEESASKSPELKQIKAKSKSTREPQTMEELLNMSGITSFSMKKGTTLNGTIISISSKEILVDIGKKSFGIVAEWELEQVRDYVKQLKVGEKVTAQVVNPENEYGYTVLSLRKASHESRWEMLADIKEKGEDIEVVCIEPAKGGILVDWQALRGFVPTTQLSVEYAMNPVSLINKRIKVKVIEIDSAINRLVLSQQASALGDTPTNQKDRKSVV